MGKVSEAFQRALFDYQESRNLKLDDGGEQPQVERRNASLGDESSR